jgi:type II secretory pathway pseudopilin PulG
MIVIAVMAIVASIGVPSFVGWRSEAKLRSAVSMLRADFEMAKSRARIENNFVAMVFNTTGYTIFIDDGAGGGVAGDYVRQADERLLITRQLPPGSPSIWPTPILKGMIKPALTARVASAEEAR